MFEGESVPLDLPMMNEEYYQVIANLGDKKAQENLDSFEEVQDFMNQMIKRNAISVDVTKLDGDTRGGAALSIKSIVKRWYYLYGLFKRIL